MILAEPVFLALSGQCPVGAVPDTALLALNQSRRQRRPCRWTRVELAEDTGVEVAEVAT